MPRKSLSTIWFSIARWFCKVFCLLFFHLRATGFENVPANGPFILACNHQSFLDPLFCGVLLRRHLHFLARDTLFSNRFFAAILRSVNCISVRRGQADVTAIRTVIAKLREGVGVCLFPEGTRSRDGRVADFKPGLGLLCRRSDSPIIPVVVEGAFECWPRHKKLPTPGSAITVRYGRCISAEQAAEMGDDALASALTETIRTMQNDIRIARGKPPFEYTHGT